jgi:hypothetical protein
MPLSDSEYRDRDRQLYLKEAIADYPNVRGFEDLITGQDEAEIRDQAARLSERLGGSRADQIRDHAGQLYGRGSGSGGNGPGSGVVGSGMVRRDDKQRRMADTAQAFNDWQENVDPTTLESTSPRPNNSQINRYGRDRMVESFLNAHRYNMWGPSWKYGPRAAEAGEVARRLPPD